MASSVENPRVETKLRGFRLLRTHSYPERLYEQQRSGQRDETTWSNGKSAIFGLKTADLNGGFRPVVVSTRSNASPPASTGSKPTSPLRAAATSFAPPSRFLELARHLHHGGAAEAHAREEPLRRLVSLGSRQDDARRAARLQVRQDRI
jgi:hypothetical protein